MITKRVKVSRKELFGLIADTRTAAGEKIVADNCPPGHRIKDIVYEASPCGEIFVELIYVDKRGGKRASSPVGRPRLPESERSARIDLWVPAVHLALLKERWGPEFKNRVRALIAKAYAEEALFDGTEAEQALPPYRVYPN